MQSDCRGVDLALLLYSSELNSTQRMPSALPNLLRSLRYSIRSYVFVKDEPLNMQLSILIVSGSMASVQRHVDERINKLVVFLDLISVSSQMY